MIGSDFLRYVDESRRIRSPLGLRFLDDFHLFNDDEVGLTQDFLAAQELLGDRGLSLNAGKTVIGIPGPPSVEDAVSALRFDLLEIRTEIIVASGVEEEQQEEVWHDLDPQHVEYLLGMLNDADIAEADAELVLILLRDHGAEVVPKMVDFLHRFPGLSKNLYQFVRFSADRAEIDAIVSGFLDSSPLATEYQLFWLAKLAEDFLAESPGYGDLLWKLYRHPNATVVSRAKVLEIPDQRFGLPDLRQEQLRAGNSDWLAWAAAAGCRGEPAGNRNHVLGYFAKASRVNGVVADCIRSLR